VCSIGLDKGGLPGVAALGMTFALASAKGGAGHILALLVPVLFLADLGAAYSFRKDVQWPVIQKLFVPGVVGMMIGVAVLQYLPDDLIKVCAGYCLALLATSHFLFPFFTQAFAGNSTLPTTTRGLSMNLSLSLLAPHSLLMAWLYGLLIGIFTVIANIAGPVAVVYFMQLGLTKYELNGTRSWLFVLANTIKIPTQFILGNIQLGDSMLIVPLALIAVVFTFLSAAFVVPLVDQRIFEQIAWVLVILGALKLILQF
jgi:uncharacterized protein